MFVCIGNDSCKQQTAQETRQSENIKCTLQRPRHDIPKLPLNNVILLLLKPSWNCQLFPTKNDNTPDKSLLFIYYLPSTNLYYAVKIFHINITNFIFYKNYHLTLNIYNFILFKLSYIYIFYLFFYIIINI